MRSRHGWAELAQRKGRVLKKKIPFIIAALITVLLSALTTGCGGGATDTTGSTPTATAPGTPTAAVIERTALAVPRQFQPDTQTPPWFKDALAKKKVILLEFYTKSDPVSTKIRSEIQSIYEKYSAEILLIILDINEPDKSATLADQFGVSFTPHISIIDKNGQVTREFSGYVDAKVIEQAVYNALNEKTD